MYNTTSESEVHVTLFLDKVKTRGLKPADLLCGTLDIERSIFIEKKRNENYYKLSGLSNLRNFQRTVH